MPRGIGYGRRRFRGRFRGGRSRFRGRRFGRRGLGIQRIGHRM